MNELGEIKNVYHSHAGRTWRVQLTPQRYPDTYTLIVETAPTAPGLNWSRTHTLIAGGGPLDVLEAAKRNAEQLMEEIVRQEAAYLEKPEPISLFASSKNELAKAIYQIQDLETNQEIELEAFMPPGPFSDLAAIMKAPAGAISFDYHGVTVYRLC